MSATLAAPRRPNRLWMVMKRDPLALVAFAFLLVLVIVAIFPEQIAQFLPNRPSRLRLRPPDATFWFGTDQFGRDIFARCVHATRVSLTVGLTTVGIAVAIGVPLGAIAAFRSPGFTDSAIMRVMDVLMAFPPIVLAIAVVAALGTQDLEFGPFVIPHIMKVMVVIGLLNAPKVARIVRAAVLVERNEQYVMAERAVGASETRILFRDVLRNCVSPVAVFATLLVATSILTEASLSFLGLGIQPPEPSWGGMLADSRTYVMSGQWWLTIFPGLLIFLTVVAFNLAGDLLRDVLDPAQLTRRGDA
ncbi:ABC transporter permease [Falsiroseomonas tokyonensis]|uniref:ABC transporter permease n=1 Tax=Falsiroseomonas tokyonensis TaxID=430521 RepID=A0ABV7C1A8_9PROT|nr:ABC transporter permease [Falsiroseomonas tokyonensis]MBU8539910.1 ABC transporter permease [Falsiroseomonas tokyonensis]